MIEPISDYRLKLKYDGQINISTGRSRFDTTWKNKRMLWSGLVAKLREPKRTEETYSEYKELPKAEQDRIKDVGGYVGGTLKDGHRGNKNVMSRQLITLDLDFAPYDFFDIVEMLADYACACYSTHKHSKTTPRYRLLIPLDREVSADEYEAIARMVASDIDMEYFDDTTYQASRLMYWPSCSSDGEYFYRYLDNPFLKADEVLARYEDWTDISSWPESSRAVGHKKKKAEKQEDPCTKENVVGAFCRTYNIHEAIEKFLSDVYTRCENPERYTYTGGSTSAGVVVYDDGKFAYSNHATDPAGGQLCNAFDLVRIHKFGEEDKDADQNTRAVDMPSYKAMSDFANKDTDTKRTRIREKKESAAQDFKDELFEDDGWKDNLEYNKRGLVISLKNLELILRGDPSLRGIVFNQLSDGMEITGKVPWHNTGRFWRDADDAQLEMYLAKAYEEFPKTKILTAITKVVDDRSYHPVRQYLNALPEWDGTKRVDTLLIDYLGAEDTPYTRAVTRKTLCGAIARVMNPGCKFDTMLVLCGKTGIGKSTIVSKLAGDWFSDNLSLSETKDKTAAEKIQGHWIIEIGELAGLKKTDIETLKGFISRQDDKYRAAYGRRVTSHKRQCIFIGTTNAEDGYLRDATGNRRFWPVNVPGGGSKNAWDLTDDEIRQIWAEVLVYHKAREPLVLDDELGAVAEIKQRDAMEHDGREGIIREYLDMLLPVNWDMMTIYERRQYVENEYNEQENNPGLYERTEVSCMEIWCEALGKNKSDYEARRSYEIAAIMKAIGGWEKRSTAKRIPIYGLQRSYVKGVTT